MTANSSPPSALSNLLGSNLELIAPEAVEDQINRTDADFSVFIKPSGTKFCTRETLNLAKTLAEDGLLRNGTPEIVVAEVA